MSLQTFQGSYKVAICDIGVNIRALDALICNFLRRHTYRLHYWGPVYPFKKINLVNTNKHFLFRAFIVPWRRVAWLSFPRY